MHAMYLTAKLFLVRLYLREVNKAAHLSESSQFFFFFSTQNIKRQFEFLNFDWLIIASSQMPYESFKVDV